MVHVQSDAQPTLIVVAATGRTVRLQRKPRRWVAAAPARWRWKTDGRRRAPGGGDVSSRRLLGAHLPAAYPERRETVAGECLGCMTQFAVDVAAASAGDVSGLRSRRARSRGHRGTAAASAVQRVADPEDGTMTLRFIVGRILRELIELAERAEDAELVDALHDALDVASPAGGLRG